MLLTVPTGEVVYEPLLLRDRVDDMERRREVRSWEKEVEMDGKAEERIVTIGFGGECVWLLYWIRSVRCLDVDCKWFLRRRARFS